MEALIRLAFALLARLPLRVNHALGAGLGWLAWGLRTDLRRVSLINLGLCFPEQDAGWHRRVARASLMETGKTLTEAPWLWHAGPQRIAALRQAGEGEAHLTEALTQGRGAFFVSPHLGSWEYSGLQAVSFGPMTNLYRPPRMQALDAPLREARQATGAQLVPTDRRGIRLIKEALARGEIVGMLPDQTPKGAQGVFAPFFGQPAMTMTLLPKLAAHRHTPVVFAFAERLPRGLGYRYRCIPAPEAIYDQDPQVAATAVNQAVEALIRQCPEQYMWSYKRFKVRPAGTPGRY
ncbi:lysophospholipid acyltransferase family protein [Ectothiorhodospira variabilis]|uniref:lysophospholipid acyltransferase family protein n=1 Tax=Ectothiorhodospira variabilis TaxID=505694 RepID=UPI001EFAEEDB|nr:lysophospholipid acyltransferase family protein [Ectothiorhodospira variabilis]MCG5496482.1 lysophospholipid acyltransferase family protein [Ectothiorhodospira variabilis]